MLEIENRVTNGIMELRRDKLNPKAILYTGAGTVSMVIAGVPVYYNRNTNSEYGMVR